VPVLRPDNEEICYLCVGGIDFPHSMVVVLYFGIVEIFVFFILIHNKKKLSQK
jgi:hypothetical protein